jgi:hypothetical protein
MTLTPIVPAVVRKNWMPPVAMPSSRLGTSFWTTSSRFCITNPSPSPSRTIASVAVRCEEPASSELSTAKPAAITTGPETSAQR